MEEKQQPTTEPQQPHRAHTYEDDVAKAMNAVDAPVVQEMLATAREREESERLETIGRRQRHLFSFFSTIFLILAAAGFGYGVYHYTRLTVPVEERVPVGVFRNTAPVVVTEASIAELVDGLAADHTLEEGEPLLVPLVTDPISLAPISKQQFFSFIGATPTEPFAFVMDTVRLGVMNTGAKNTTFVVLSVPDPQLASKEFLIAEQELLGIFAPALGLNAASYEAQAGKEYASAYLYNLPVRLLTAPDPVMGTDQAVLLYGYASGNVIVITTDQQVLRAVSDTIIKQSH